MIWTKTDSGRAEISARALVHERARRNLLLLIDGFRSQDVLLGSVVGINHGDFDLLARLGLIAHGSIGGSSASRPAAAAAAPSQQPDASKLLTPPSYAEFTARLTRLISSELGLRGFRLTLAVEKAADVQALEPVAERVISEITRRKGEAVARTARRTLYSA